MVSDASFADAVVRRVAATLSAVSVCVCNPAVLSTALWLWHEDRLNSVDTMIAVVVYFMVDDF